MPPIISLACSEDHADKLCAIATLRGIASDPDTRIKIVEEGGLEPLALGARIMNVEVHREAARCAASLALNEGNKVIMSDHEVLPDIIRLAQSTDAETARYACGTLANLAENFETHEGIIEVAGLLFITKLAGGAAVDNDVELQREGKYSKRRANVAVIIVSIVFVTSFFFYCLLLNHSFPTNPNKITNCF